VVKQISSKIIIFNDKHHNLKSFVVQGTLIFLPVLSKIFKVRDGAIGVVSLLGNFGSHVTVAFATTTLMMYLCK